MVHPYWKDEKTVIRKTGGGFMDVVHTMKGYPGAKFDTRDTRLSLRRVDPDGDDHVQIEVLVTEYFEKTGQTRQKRGYVRLEKDQLQQLMEHLSKPWEGIRR